MTEKDDKDRSKVFKNIELIVEETRERAESLSDNVRESMKWVLSSRDNVVMVRVNKEAIERMDDLVVAQIANSRSEAAAFLIGEGIKSRQSLFDKICSKIEEIRKAKEDLRRLLDEEDESPQAPSQPEAQRSPDPE